MHWGGEEGGKKLYGSLDEEDIIEKESGMFAGNQVFVNFWECNF